MFGRWKRDAAHWKAEAERIYREGNAWNKELRGKLTRADDANARLNVDANQLRDDLAHAKNDRDDALARAVAAAANERFRVDADVRQLKGRLSAADLQLAAERQDNERLNVENNRLAFSIAAKGNSLSAAELQLEAERKDNAKLKSMYVAADNRAIDAGAEIFRLKALLALTKGLLLEIEGVRDAAYGACNKLAAQLDHAQHCYEQCEIDRRAIAKERDEAAEERDAFRLHVQRCDLGVLAAEAERDNARLVATRLIKTLVDVQHASTGCLNGIMDQLEAEATSPEPKDAPDARPERADASPDHPGLPGQDVYRSCSDAGCPGCSGAHFVRQD